MPARNTTYKIRRLPAGVNPTPGNTPGTEATQAPTPGIPPDVRVVPPGHRIATTMEIRSQIADIMNSRNYHPVRELVDMVQAQRPALDAAGRPRLDEHNRPIMEFVYDAEFRKSIHAELAPYIAPKLKAIDMQVQGKMQISVKIVKFSDEAQRRIDSAKPAERVIDI